MFHRGLTLLLLLASGQVQGSILQSLKSRLLWSQPAETEVSSPSSLVSSLASSLASSTSSLASSLASSTSSLVTSYSVLGFRYIPPRLPSFLRSLWNDLLFPIIDSLVTIDVFGNIVIVKPNYSTTATTTAKAPEIVLTSAPTVNPITQAPTTTATTSKPISTTTAMLPRTSNTTGCGVKGDKTRIIGGTDASENEFPWICSILKEDSTFYGCAATLLTCFPTVVIVSAAHCFKRRTQEEISKLQVACGDHKNSGFIASNIDSNEWRVKIQSITIHPRYQGAQTYWDNDIAVIKISLQDELQFSLVCRPKVIWPACWPHRGQQYAWWRDSEVAGWGTVNTAGIVLPPSLQTTTVLPVSQFGCETVMGQDRITDNMICGFGDGTDTCQGDSGGPMTSQAQAGGGYSLIGITSWGDGCALEDTYGVYTRVESYMDWVAQQYGYSGVG